MKQTVWMRKILLVGLSLALLVPVLAACTKGEGGNQEEKRVLRIATLYGDSYNSEYLRSQYTDLFQFNNRNIDIEFVYAVDYSNQRYRTYDPEKPVEEPNPLEEMKKLLESANPPDLIMVSYDELAPLIEDNLLMPLDSFIAEDEFDISGFVPAVIDSLKALGNNQLYALAPTFTSDALVYNKGLFAELGVTPPTDNMTWNEIFDLARLIARGEGEDRIFGFSFTNYLYSDLFYDMRTYTAPWGLRMYDEQGETMLVDNDQWEAAWRTMVELYSEKVVPTREYFDEIMMKQRGRYNPLMENLFLSGKVAMTLMNYRQLDEIINANNNKDAIEGFNGIDWDVVTFPVHPEAPDIGGNVSIYPIFAINAKAQNSEDAWEFIKFINGKDWAEFKSGSISDMLSRKEYIKPRDGLNFNIAAFYQLKPAPNVYNSRIYMEKPNIYEVERIGREKFEQVLNGDKEIREALREWNTEGNMILQQIKENPNGPLEIYRSPVI